MKYLNGINDLSRMDRAHVAILVVFYDVLAFAFRADSRKLFLLSSAMNGFSYAAGVLIQSF